MEKNEHYKQLLMHSKIHELSELGLSKRSISQQLSINFRTVKKYLKMSIEEFETFLKGKEERPRLLAPYEAYVKDCLTLYPETSAAQMHDWLKEKHQNFPDVPTRTVFNFVMWVRQKHNLPKKETHERLFEESLQLPAGLQAQVDFGQSTLRRTNGGRQKVYFLSMVLSMSRYKYVYLQTEPFTAYSAIQAHEKAFAYFGGIPRQLVYDQDAVFLVDENLGDLVLVDTFRRYVESRTFKTYFCRKEDPQTKGKIERVVGYVKHNFLFNRPFSNIEALNEQALAWLERTGNALVHQRTHRIPKLVWQEEERDQLLSYMPIGALTEPPKGYKVLKTNVLLYRGNTYSMPFGYYRGENTIVHPREEEGMLLIYDEHNVLVASHKIPEIKGQQVVNRDHQRNRSEAMNTLKERFCTFFDHHALVGAYMDEIAGKYPRYLRDQLTAILAAGKKAGLEDAVRALECCVDNHIVGANNFKTVLCAIQADRKAEMEASTDAEKRQPTPDSTRLMGPSATQVASIQPSRSSVDTYENIFNNQRS